MVVVECGSRRGAVATTIVMVAKWWLWCGGGDRGSGGVAMMGWSYKKTSIPSTKGMVIPLVW